MEMTKNDTQNISFLKKELETNYKLLKQTYEREEVSAKKIENLHEEIKKYH